MHSTQAHLKHQLHKTATFCYSNTSTLFHNQLTQQNLAVHSYIMSVHSYIMSVHSYIMSVHSYIMSVHSYIMSVHSYIMSVHSYIMSVEYLMQPVLILLALTSLWTKTQGRL
jgi:predicted neutral ceramidase superfamily lipid hydrolase